MKAKLALALAIIAFLFSCGPAPRPEELASFLDSYNQQLQSRLQQRWGGKIEGLEKLNLTLFSLYLNNSEQAQNLAYFYHNYLKLRLTGSATYRIRATNAFEAVKHLTKEQISALIEKGFSKIQLLDYERFLKESRKLFRGGSNAFR